MPEEQEKQAEHKDPLSEFDRELMDQFGTMDSDVASLKCLARMTNALELIAETLERIEVKI